MLIKTEGLKVTIQCEGRGFNMFSQNGMISSRQMRRILMLSVFSGGIFVMPYLFASMFGDAFITGIITFVIISALYVGLILMLGKGKIIDPACDKKDKLGDRVRVLVYVVRYTIRLVFYMVLAVAIIGEGQVPFVNKNAGNSFGNLMVLLPLLLVAYYGALKGLEEQGRTNEMIFWASFFPYVLMLLFGLKEMDRDILVPKTGLNISILLRCYALLTFIVPVEIYPQLKLNRDKEHTSLGMTYFQVMLMIILIAVLAVMMAGIYGLNGMGKEPMISVAIMRYIELPLGVLQRFDVLMVWFFMTGVFAAISGILFRIRRRLLEVVSKGTGEITLIVILIASLFMCLGMPKYEITLDAFVVYGAFVDVPLSILTMTLDRRSIDIIKAQ